MVRDVHLYEKFVPWIARSHVFKDYVTVLPDGRTKGWFDVELTIGF